MMATFSIIGYGQRGLVYAREGDKIADFVAVCDINQERLDQAKKDYNLSQDNVFLDEDSFFSRPKLSDYLFICTQDSQHYEHTLKALRAGYNVLLEKPIACSLRECIDIEKEAKRLGKSITVCHVLRYTSFYRKLKELINSGIIGKIIAVQQNENVGYWHQAHSFVRGNWGNSGDSSPMILAKCCHDLDILAWLAGSDCKYIWSHGDLYHFKEQDAPDGSSERCLDGCRVIDSCPYSAKKIYIDRYRKILTPARKYFWPYSVLSEDNVASMDKIINALKTGPYGRCVYRCDNDVVDYQVVNMVFQNNINVTLTMTAFSADLTREVILRGTLGEIRGTMENHKIHVTLYGKRSKRIHIKTLASGHGGGDANIIKDLFTKGTDNISHAVMSHAMAFAAEESRLNEGKRINIQEYIKGMG